LNASTSRGVAQHDEAHVRGAQVFGVERVAGVEHERVLGEHVDEPGAVDRHAVRVVAEARLAGDRVGPARLTEGVDDVHEGVGELGLGVADEDRVAAGAHREGHRLARNGAALDRPQ
jgi:hypothetical protein